MAYYSKFLSSFVLVSLLLMFMSTCHSSPENKVVKIPTNGGYDEKVDVSIYYETLCPGCANFIVEKMSELIQTGLVDFVNFKMVPWGNARLNQSTKTISCQHGEDECYLNTIHACAINVWPDNHRHIIFITCMEDLALKGGHEKREQIWQRCCQILELDPKLLKDCYDSGLGTKLELKYGEETMNLNPPHEYVPWVIVDNNPIHTDFDKFSEYICKAYKGSVIPEPCKKRLKLNSNSAEKTNQANLICRAEHQPED